MPNAKVGGGTKSGFPDWGSEFHPGIAFMLIKGIVVAAALTALAPDAVAAEQPGLVRRASCSVVRYYVAKYSAAAAEAWARSRGATDAEIEVARRCVANAPASAQAAIPTVATAGWAGQ